MAMKDYEVLDADLFEYTGLSDASVEDMAHFIQEFGRLLSITGILRAGEQLSEKDQDTLVRLLTDEEGERAQAFLSLKGIDFEEIMSEEVIRIKRAIIESGKTLRSTDELIVAVKSHLSLDALQLEGASLLTVIQEIQEYIDSLPFSDEQKARLAHSVEEKASQRVEEYIRSVLSSEIISKVDELMDQDREGEALLLMLQHGIDFAQLNTEEAQQQLNALKEQFAFLKAD
jgi:hypothetical protein